MGVAPKSINMATPLKPWEKVAGSNSRPPGPMESGEKDGKSPKPAIPPRPISAGDETICAL